MESILSGDISKMRVIILSDRRIGHLNQSIALAKYLKAEYEIVEVVPIYRWSKAVSYIFDYLKIMVKILFKEIETKQKTYDMVIGTGSWTYYMTKVFAKQFHAKAVTMMLPRGYRYDYDIIFAQSHDNPPKQNNIIEIPANFSYIEPKGLYEAKRKSIGIVIGGDNKVFKIDLEILKKQLDFIKQYYCEYEIAITTSPRTSKEIDELIRSYRFDYEVIYSENPVNPIPDFLEQCETVFITGDSTSMISEAVAYGESNIIVLLLESKSDNKFTRFIFSLAQKGYLHIFDGTIQNKNKKIDFSSYLHKVVL